MKPFRSTFSLFFPPLARPHVAVLAAVSLLAGARAEASAPAALTLAGALARATDRHPALVAQAHDERAAAARVEQAGYGPRSTLGVEFEDFLGTGRAQGVRALQATIEASRTFERGGKRDKRVALAGSERELANHELAVRRAEILAGTAAAYLAAVAARQRLPLAAEPVRLAQETLALVETRARAGAGSQAEVARARAALATVAAEQARIEAAVASARTALALSWGGDVTDAAAFSLPSSLRLPASLPPADDLRARLASHPRLRVQAAIVANRRAALALEQAQAVPDITARGGLRFLREGSDAGFVAGLSVPLPTRHQNQGNIRAARETLAGAEQTVRAIEAALRAAFDAAWQEANAAHALAQQLRRDALPPTEDAFAAVRRAYDAGPIPLTDVLDAQRALAALHRDILAAEAACAAALVRAEALVDPAFPLAAALLFTP